MIIQMIKMISYKYYNILLLLLFSYITTRIIYIVNITKLQFVNITLHTNVTISPLP